MSDGQGVDVYVNADGAPDAPVDLVARAARHALRACGVGSGDLSVTLLDDDDIRALNRRYLSRDRPTDVIAFSLGEAPTLGDVYIGYDRARSQATDREIPLAEELVRLAIHGTLHVLGHEHPEGPERLESPMFDLQERLVREVLAGP